MSCHYLPRSRALNRFNCRVLKWPLHCIRRMRSKSLLGRLNYKIKTATAPCHWRSSVSKHANEQHFWLQNFSEKKRFFTTLESTDESNPTNLSGLC